MDAQKLVKRFRRELLANPKKAAILGLLALVALYFWAPLVLGRTTKGKSSGAEAASPAAGASPAPPQETVARPVAAAAKAENPQIPWEQLLKWMDEDPQTLPAALVADQRNPFLPVKPPVPASKPETEPKPPPKVTPQSLGLTLSSTIVGPHRRVARIHGRTYQQGEVLEVIKDGYTFTFTLAEVHPRRVVLTRDGAAFELTIPDPTRSPRIEVLRNGN